MNRKIRSGLMRDVPHADDWLWLVWSAFIACGAITAACAYVFTYAAPWSDHQRLNALEELHAPTEETQ